MSSLRNAVKRVTHKERSQPSHRKKLGLLEKHSDYVERANDFKKKRGIINTLKRKTQERNPDEFYFKMNVSEVQNGKHVLLAERNKSLDHDTVQLLKTQDAGYVTHKRAVNDKKVERMKESLHLVGAVLPRHKVFVESQEEVASFDIAKHFDTLPELVPRAYNRPRVGDLDEHAASSASASVHKAVNKAMGATYAELSSRVQRSEKISKAADELQLQRHLMGKGSKRKMTIVGEGGDEKVVYKWKRQRSR